MNAILLLCLGPCGGCTAGGALLRLRPVATVVIGGLISATLLTAAARAVRVVRRSAFAKGM